MSESFGDPMKKLAPILIISAGLLWGILGVFSRMLGEMGWKSIEVTEARCIVAGAALILFLLIFDREKLKIQIKDLWMFLGTGLCSLVFFNLCSFYTIAHTTMAVASMLLYTAPCMVMVMAALFFHEKITREKLASVAAAILGCVFITDLAGARLSPWLLLTGLGAGFGYALYSIFSVPALKKYSPITVTVYTFIVAGIFLIPFARPWEMVESIESAQGVLGVLGLGLLSTLAPYLLYTKGLQYTEASRASVMAFSEPLCATLAGVALFEETLTLKNMVGILLIFLSIVMINMKKMNPCQ